ncbi:MAG: hypothetical protein R3B45_11360 [Bdellovibrionota bacterium]
MHPTPVIIVEQDLDEETVKDLEELRAIRLGIAVKQLEDLSSTMNDLNGLVTEPFGTDDLSILLLKKELEEKIAILKSRIDLQGVFYFDEIQFYLGFKSGLHQFE